MNRDDYIFLKIFSEGKKTLNCLIYLGRIKADHLIAQASQQQQLDPDGNLAANLNLLVSQHNNPDTLPVKSCFRRNHCRQELCDPGEFADSGISNCPNIICTKSNCCSSKCFY